MTTVEYNQNIDKFVNYLQNSFNHDYTLKGVTDMSSAIVKRVQGKGIDSEGGQFKGYSTKDILVGAKSFINPTGFEKLLSKAVEGQSRKLKGKTKQEGKMAASGYRWVTIESGGRMVHLVVLPGGYKKLRQLDNLKVDHKSFTRTGMMWKGFGIKSETKNKFVLGGKNEDSQNKIDGNTAREEKVIIYPSKQEIDTLTQYVDDSLRKVLKNYV